MKSNRTVVVRYADAYILENSAEYFLQNINENNSSWLRVVDLFKFLNGKAFKFECKTTEMANSYQSRGSVTLSSVKISTSGFKSSLTAEN